jgi:hypothetical protein
MPLQGTAACGDEQARAGECLLLEPGATLDVGAAATVLVGAEGRI